MTALNDSLQGRATKSPQGSCCVLTPRAWSSMAPDRVPIVCSSTILCIPLLCTGFLLQPKMDKGPHSRGLCILSQISG